MAHRWRPELGIESSRIQEAFNAMVVDALPGGRPVRQAITENRQISSAFDFITYQKGAQVLAMFEGFVGPEVFAEALRVHLTRFRHGNATSDDFFRTVSEVATHPKLVAALQTFVDQTGVPLINVRPADGKLALTQERYRPLGVDTSRAAKWMMPVCVSQAETRACALLEERTGDIDVSAGHGALMPNADGAGYYRFRRDDAGWKRLIAGSASLSGAEALALADSVWSDFAAGPGNFARVIAAAKALSAHEERLAVIELGDRLRDLATSVLTLDQMDAYGNEMRAIYAPRLSALGLDVTRGARTAANLRTSKRSGNPCCPSSRSKRGTKRCAPSYRMRQLPTSMVMRQRWIRPFGLTHSPWRFKRGACLSCGNIELVEREFERAMNTLPSFLRPRLSMLYARTCTLEDVARAEAFFRPKLAMLGGGELELEQTKQRIRACSAVRAAKRDEISAALAAS